MTTSKIKWEEKSLTILTSILGVFFLAKVINVYTPLFHDELGVYGRALFYMVDNGPSMIPGDVDPEISRGHPLFFAFFIGLVSSLFGGSYVVARCTILLLALALLGTTYLLGKELGGKKTGLLSTMILSFQPIFFSQSTLVLPEVMLGLLGMLSLLFYVRKQYIFYFLVASLLVLTKETAVVVLGGIVLYEWYLHKFRIDLAMIGKGIKWTAPIVCFIGFLCVQRMQHGWFLYPYHTGLMSFAVGSILIRLTLSLIILFLDQGRFILTIAMIIALRKMTKEERTQIWEKNALGIAVSITMLAFSCLNYFMPRYFILILPLVVMLFVSVLQTRDYSIRQFVVYFLLVIPFQCNFWVFRNDDNMGYLIVVNNMQNSIAELDKITNGKPAKIFAQFPEINALEEPRNGYTINPNYTLTDKYDETVDYILKSGNEHLIMDEVINNVDYGLDKTIDKIINNPEALEASKMELLYDEKLFYNRQRIFRTNNNK